MVSDGRIVELGIEEVLALEPDLVLDAGLSRIVLGFENALGIDVDAERTRALLGRRDGDPAITGAQIDDEVVLPHGGHLEHPVDDFGRGRHIRHIQRRSIGRAGPGRCRKA